MKWRKFREVSRRNLILKSEKSIDKSWKSRWRKKRQKMISKRRWKKLNQMHSSRRPTLNRFCSAKSRDTNTCRTKRKSKVCHTAWITSLRKLNYRRLSKQHPVWWRKSINAWISRKCKYPWWRCRRKWKKWVLSRKWWMTHLKLSMKIQIMIIKMKSINS